MADELDPTDVEIQELIRKRHPLTWHLGWSKAEYESARQEIIARWREEERRTRVRWGFENCGGASEDD